MLENIGSTPLSVGERVRSLRGERGLSQERLARAADVSTSTIRRLELTGELPHTTTLIAVARALGVSVDALVGEAA